MTNTAARVILVTRGGFMKEIENRYYSMPEIMQYLGVSRDSVLRWIATKDMPAYKLGKNWKFKISEIDEWINSGKAKNE